MTSQNQEHPADSTGDRDVPPSPGDMPTPDEEQAAERAAETAPDVGESYTELNKLGAQSEGEGRIED